MSLEFLILSIIFMVGLIVGSFLNVCIYRMPRGEEVIMTRSHCTQCGYTLKWFDLIPILSWILLQGKCRKCGESISMKYPLTELLNAVLWTITCYLCGVSFATAFLCLCISALIVLSFIDFETYEIPIGINYFLGIMAILHLLCDREQTVSYLVGAILVSGILLILFTVTKGRAIGGGDVKLMAVAGLLLGYQLIFIAFMFGCFYGAVIHSIRIKKYGEGHVLAMGPYLSMGIITAMWFGKQILNWYYITFYGYAV